MAVPKGQERGLRIPVQLRAGIDLPYWQGLNLDKDPGAIGDAELQNAINVRLNAGRIENRGGQVKLTESALDGCVWSIDDLPLPGAGIFLSHDNGAYQLDEYNTDISPNYRGLLVNPPALIGTHRQFGNSVAPRQTLGVWAKKLLAFDDQSGTPSTNSQIYEVVFPVETDTAGQVTLRLLFEVPTCSVSCVVTEAGVDTLYIGGVDDDTVYRWDGTSLTNDGALASTAQRLIVGPFHDRLFVAGTQYARVRNPGAPTVNGTPNSGAYVNVTVSGTTTFEPSSMCEFGSKLVVAGRDSSIIPAAGVPGPGCLMVYDPSGGTSVLSLAYQPVDDSVTPAPALGVSDCVVWNGKVWFLWLTFGASRHNWVGTYDGTTWDATVGNLGVTEAATVCGDLLVANGLLYATLYHLDDGGNEKMYMMSTSDGVTWTDVQQIDSTSYPANMALYSV